MSKKKKIILAYGGSTMDIESPAQALFEMIRNSEESAIEASNDPTVAGLKMLGKTMTKVGTSMVGQGLSQSGDLGGFGGFMQDNWGDISKGLDYAQMFTGAYGGKVPSEIEGEEVVETPNGFVTEFKGPSHEQGGIDLMLPGGSEVFSKRIKIDGVTIADRKKKREKKTVTLEELLSKNPTDNFIKNSLSRTKKNNDKEEQLDKNVQSLVGNVLAPPVKNKFAYGTADPVDGGYNPLSLAMLMNFMTNGNTFENSDKPIPEFGSNGNPADIEEVVIQATPKSLKGPAFNDNIIEKPMDVNLPEPRMYSKNAFQVSPEDESSKTSGGFDFGSMFENFSFGDAIGMAGNLYSAFAPMQNTLKNRKGDIPNINAFKDFGKDALAKMTESEKYVEQMKYEALKDAELNKTGTINRNNRSARGINTQRALNLVADVMFGNAKSDIYNNSAKQMMSILAQEAGLENQQDQAVMQGEYARDLADRMDRDNFFSQMAQDIATKGKGIQQIGKDYNQIKQGRISENLVNQLSQYGITIDKNGNVTYDKNKVKPAENTSKKKTAETDATVTQSVNEKKEYVKNSSINGLSVSKDGKFILNGIEMTDEQISQLEQFNNFYQNKLKKKK